MGLCSIGLRLVNESLYGRSAVGAVPRSTIRQLAIQVRRRMHPHRGLAITTRGVGGRDITGIRGSANKGGDKPRDAESDGTPGCSTSNSERSTSDEEDEDKDDESGEDEDAEYTSEEQDDSGAQSRKRKRNSNGRRERR